MTAADRVGRLQRRREQLPPGAAAPPERTEPVRQTVDISPADHARLTTAKVETMLALGRTRLSVQALLVALIEEYLDDDALQRRVRLRLERR